MKFEQAKWKKYPLQVHCLKLRKSKLDLIKALLNCLWDSKCCIDPCINWFLLFTLDSSTYKIIALLFILCVDFMHCLKPD